MFIKNEIALKEEKKNSIEDSVIMLQLADMLAEEELLTPDERAELIDLIRREKL